MPTFFSFDVSYHNLGYGFRWFLYSWTDHQNWDFPANLHLLGSHSRHQICCDFTVHEKGETLSINPRDPWGYLPRHIFSASDSLFVVVNVCLYYNLPVDLQDADALRLGVLRLVCCLWCVLAIPYRNKYLPLKPDKADAYHTITEKQPILHTFCVSTYQISSPFRVTEMSTRALRIVVTGQAHQFLDAAAGDFGSTVDMGIWSSFTACIWC